MEVKAITLVELVEMSDTEFRITYGSNGRYMVPEIVTGKRTYVVDSIDLTKEFCGTGCTIVIHLVEAGISRCWFSRERPKPNKIDITLED